MIFVRGYGLKTILLGLGLLLLPLVGCTGQEKEAELLGQLEASRAEYEKCLAAFQEAESTVEERTKWALALSAEIGNLNAQLDSIRGSKWVRLGRSFGIGPKVE